MFPCHTKMKRDSVSMSYKDEERQCFHVIQRRRVTVFPCHTKMKSDSVSMSYKDEERQCFHVIQR